MTYQRSRKATNPTGAAALADVVLSLSRGGNAVLAVNLNLNLQVSILSVLNPMCSRCHGLAPAGAK